MPECPEIGAKPGKVEARSTSEKIALLLFIKASLWMSVFDNYLSVFPQSSF
jgi:hypothetical protein